MTFKNNRRYLNQLKDKIRCPLRTLIEYTKQGIIRQCYYVPTQHCNKE